MLNDAPPLLGHRALQGIDRETFLRDRDAQAKAERWLRLAGEVAIDLATQLIVSPSAS